MEQLHKPRDWVTSQIPEALRSQYLAENPKYLKGDWGAQNNSARMSTS